MNRNNVKRFEHYCSPQKKMQKKYFKKIQNNFNTFSILSSLLLVAPFFAAFSSLSKTTVKIFVFVCK